MQWNPDADRILAQMVANTAAALDEISQNFVGKPVEQVKPALAARWAASNEGAAITEPDLSTIAALISEGKRVWIEADGKIMADD